VISLPGGGQTVANGPLNLACGGVSVDRLTVRQPQFHAWCSPLRINLTIPANVNAGATLTYVATLTNPTTRPIRINPCPGYLESLTGQGIKIVHAPERPYAH
jgi:hypothetical protein